MFRADATHLSDVPLRTNKPSRQVLYAVVVPAKTESKVPLKERLKSLLAEYGPVAFVTYLVLFGTVFAGFLIAISAGLKSTTGSVGPLMAAWLATKVTQPLRIGATLLLTPLVARVVRRGPRKAPAAEPVPLAGPENSDDDESD